MSNLFGSQPKVIPEFTGLQVNTAVQVLPIPIIYGSPRVSLNLIYYNGFNSQLVNQKSGKGILSGGKGNQTVEYFATLIMAVGEGYIGEVFIIYQDQDVWVPGDYPSNGAYYFGGTSTQTPWSYVEGTWPQDARAYKDTAYYAFQNAQLDSSATVPQIDLVVKGVYAGTSPLNNSTITITTGQYDAKGNPLSFIGSIPLGDADADPASVIYDFLTNSTYGATFPANYIDTTTLYTSENGYTSGVGDAALSTYCQAVGLAWSVVINNAEAANSILDRWTKNLQVAGVWNGSVLKFIPYWDRYAAGNPNWDSGNGIPLKYFTPLTTPLVTITLDQILQSDNKDEDPITFDRKDPMEVYNTVRVDFRDRTNFFNNVPAQDFDEAHVELYGPRIDNIGLADEFTLATYAQTSATMQLRRNIAVVLTYTWKMGPLWGWFDPMDLVSIPDPTNWSNFITVRIISVTDDEDENVTIEAENFPVGAQSPTIIPMSATTPPNQGATNNPPSNIYPPVIFAPTTDLLTAMGYSTPQFVFGASGGNASSFDGTFDTNWGGCFVWASLDNVSYQQLGQLTGPSVVGFTTDALSGYSGSNPDNVDTLYVDLNQCNGSLPSYTGDSASAGTSICVIQDASGFEVFSYTVATLVSGYSYALTGLYRGLYGTTSRMFGSGSQFLFLGNGSNNVEEDLPSSYVGKTFYVKAQSYNVYNNATQDLSDCVVYTYLPTSPTPVGPVPPPTIGANFRRIGPKITSSVVTSKTQRRKN